MEATGKVSEKANIVSGTGHTDASVKAKKDNEVVAKKKAAEKSAVGHAGEELAAKFLIEKGHTVIERNFRKKSGEIDIISIDEKGIHFVEVKTRRPPAMSAPAEAVNATKQRKIVSTATRWLSKHGSDIIGQHCKTGHHSSDRDCKFIGNLECFFDIIGVMFKADGKTEIDYIQQAFVPTYV